MSTKRAWCLSQRDFVTYCRKRGWKQLGVEPDEAVISICCNPDVSKKVLGGYDYHYLLPSENVLDVEWDFLVHCNAGKSRSQAVIRYITEFYPEHSETNPDNPCLYPNIHTYSALKKAREAL